MPFFSLGNLKTLVTYSIFCIKIYHFLGPLATIWLRFWQSGSQVRSLPARRGFWALEEVEPSEELSRDLCARTSPPACLFQIAQPSPIPTVSSSLQTSAVLDDTWSVNSPGRLELGFQTSLFNCTQDSYLEELPQVSIRRQQLVYMYLVGSCPWYWLHPITVPGFHWILSLTNLVSIYLSNSVLFQSLSGSLRSKLGQLIRRPMLTLSLTQGPTLKAEQGF